MGIPILMACPVILAALGLAALGLVLWTGAVNCRAEDEYWERFWSETPIACLGGGEAEQVSSLTDGLRLAA